MQISKVFAQENSSKDKNRVREVNTSDHTNTISLCAINFKSFSKLNFKIKNIEASLLFTKIHYDLHYAKCTALIKTRKELGRWIGFNEKKVSHLLAILEDKKLIKKDGCSYFGVRKLKITPLYTLSSRVVVNFKVLNHLYDQFKSIKTSLIFSKIAFAFNNTTIEHHCKKWCALSKSDLAKWSGLDIQTIRKQIKFLIEKGYILEEKFQYNGRYRSHFHITAPALSILLNPQSQSVVSKSEKSVTKEKVTHTQKYTAKQVTHTQIPQGKMAFPINKRTHSIEEINNTETRNDISFNNASEGCLNKRQKRFLISALEKTYARKTFPRSNFKTIQAEVEYFILNVLQSKRVSSFKHAVNRAMKILRDRNWRTPFGFHKYSENGKKIKEISEKKEKAWEKTKKQECHFTQLEGENILDCQKISKNQKQIKQKAKSILRHIKHCQSDENQMYSSSAMKSKLLLEKLYGLLGEGLDSEWLKVNLEELNDCYTKLTLEKKQQNVFY